MESEIDRLVFRPPGIGEDAGSERQRMKEKVIEFLGCLFIMACTLLIMVGMMLL
jgi:hypothetical protein